MFKWQNLLVEDIVENVGYNSTKTILSSEINIRLVTKI